MESRLDGFREEVRALRLPQQGGSSSTLSTRYCFCSVNSCRSSLRVVWTIARWKLMASSASTSRNKFTPERSRDSPAGPRWHLETLHHSDALEPLRPRTPLLSPRDTARSVGPGARSGPISAPLVPNYYLLTVQLSQAVIS